METKKTEVVENKKTEVLNTAAQDVETETDETSEEEQLREKMMTQMKTGPFVHKLSRPVTIGDKTFTEITLDFTALSTDDMDKVARYPECGVAEGTPSREFNKTYLLHMVARAAKIKLAELRKFPIADGTQLTLKMQDFLFNAAAQTM